MIREAELERKRRRMLKPWAFRGYLWSRLPLAAFAGLSLRRLDSSACVVALPGGWRTRNPFGSAYFAAQAMAAEMSTGAPALLLAQSSDVSMALILTELRATFSKRVLGTSLFSFEDVAGLRAVVEAAGAGSDAARFVARSTGRLPDGTLAAEFEVTWSFKRRG